MSMKRLKSAPLKLIENVRNDDVSQVISFVVTIAYKVDIGEDDTAGSLILTYRE